MQLFQMIGSKLMIKTRSIDPTCLQWWVQIPQATILEHTYIFYSRQNIKTWPTQFCTKPCEAHKMTSLWSSMDIKSWM
jgi:hypothetical protein